MGKKHVILAGAAPDTGNLGVSALCYSSVANLSKEMPDLEVDILDHGKGYRKGAYVTHDGVECNVLGAKHSKRFYEQSSFVNVRTTIKLGPLASPTAKLFKRANALLDISGGDSFTDLYLRRRFNAIVLPKIIAIENNIPLVLLPQTYGPFQKSDTRALAQKILRGTQLAYARDKYSFEYMKELLGADFDEERHKLGVDVAFLLPTETKEHVQALGLLPEQVEGKEIFGINVSGLIYNDPAVAKSQYGISIDYHKVLHTFIGKILEESDGDVWLVPHVLAPFEHFESDARASEQLKATFNQEQQSRIKVITGKYDQCEIKAVIAQCDWFMGTRMHSTVGSLSNCVPTTALAYSGKTKGVFKTADQEDKVLDARTDTTDYVLEKMIEHWHQRTETRAALNEFIPKLKARATDQFKAIANKIA